MKDRFPIGKGNANDSQASLIGVNQNGSSREGRSSSESMEQLNNMSNLVGNDVRQIIESARAEIAELQESALNCIALEREQLEREKSEIEAIREKLDAERSDLETRVKFLENETFEEACAKGYNEGFEKGYEEGGSEGREEAQQRYEEDVEKEVQQRLKETASAALEPLRTLCKEMNNTRHLLLKNWEENILQIAAAIAYQAIMREVSVFKEVPLALLREALDLSMSCTSLKIRMNSQDIKNLQEPIKILLEETGNLAKAEIVADAKITCGGCVVESSLGVVDERLEARLERIISELSE